MRSRIIYKSLFEIKLLHHYFLDKGEEIWDAMAPEDRDLMEEKYDIRDILEITPTPDCNTILNSHNCIFKQTSSGIRLGIKAKPVDTASQEFIPFIPLENDLSFRFLIRLKKL